jgi:hypothetical protein
MIAALTGALPSGRLEEVGCKIVFFDLKKLKHAWELYHCIKNNNNEAFLSLH